MNRIRTLVAYPKVTPKPKATIPGSAGRVVGTHRQWTLVEDQIVRKEYPGRETYEVAEMLPGRTDEAIRRRALDLGVYKTPECVARIRAAGFMRSLA